MKRKAARKVALLISLLLVCSMVLTACGGADKNTLAIHVGSDPDTLDPALNSAVDGGTLIYHAFEGLMTLDRDGVPIPGQAYDYDISNDGKTYTFYLRDGIKWSDGQPVTANDFVYAWNRAISPDTAADYEYMFDVIEGYEDGKLNVTAIDEKTLEVNLTTAVPYFLELCAFPAYFPVRQDIIEKYGEGWAVDPKSYIGNGPYKMVKWVPGSHIIYEKNKNYWNYESLGMEKLKFVLMDDDNSILSAFRNEEILFADSMPNDAISALSKTPEYHLQGQLGTYYVSFNTKRAPLDNPKVRKALILAVDRDFICVNIGQSGQQPAGAFVPIGLFDTDPSRQFREVGGDYYNPAKEANEANLEEAKRLLAEAGYPNGEGFPTLEYIYNENTGHQQVGEALQDMWKKIGVNITLVSQEWNTFLNTRKNGEYDIARNGWLADYNDPISFLDMWITGSGNNDAQWSNAEYDEIIKKVKSTTDPEERYELMHRAEDIIFEESMLCPIYYYVDTYLLNQKIEGFYSTPLGWKFFMYATVKSE